MSSIAPPPYSPLRPPSPAAGYQRDGTANNLRTQPLVGSPTELLAGTCINIGTTDFRGQIVIFVTFRLVTIGSSGVRSAQIFANTDGACAVPLVTQYPHHVTALESGGVVSGLTLIETTQTCIYNVLGNVSSPGSLFLSSTRSHAAHRIWYRIASFTLDN